MINAEYAALKSPRFSTPMARARENLFLNSVEKGWKLLEDLDKNIVSDTSSTTSSSSCNSSNTKKKSHTKTASSSSSISIRSAITETFASSPSISSSLLSDKTDQRKGKLFSCLSIN